MPHPAAGWTWDDMTRRGRRAARRRAATGSASRRRSSAWRRSCGRTAATSSTTRRDPTRLTLDTPEALDALERFLALRHRRPHPDASRSRRPRTTRPASPTAASAMYLNSRRVTPQFRLIDGLRVGRRPAARARRAGRRAALRRLLPDRRLRAPRRRLRLRRVRPRPGGRAGHRPHRPHRAVAAVRRRVRRLPRPGAAAGVVERCSSTRSRRSAQLPTISTWPEIERRGQRDPRGGARGRHAGRRGRPRSSTRRPATCSPGPSEPMAGADVRRRSASATATSPRSAALDLDVGDGEAVCVLGPSGSGKSTALRLAAGLERVSAGRDPDRRRRRHGAGRRPSATSSMVFQSYALFPHLDVAENIGFGLAVRKVPQARASAGASPTSPSSSGAAHLLAPPARTSSPAASASASPWPGRSCGGRRSCCSTSRCPTSTRRCAPTCASSCAGCTTPSARRWSTSPTTSSRRCRSATASPSSATAASSRPGSPDDVYRRPANRFVATFVGQPRMNVLPVVRARRARSRVGPFTLPGRLAPDGDRRGRDPTRAPRARRPTAASPSRRRRARRGHRRRRARPPRRRRPPARRPVRAPTSRLRARRPGRGATRPLDRWFLFDAPSGRTRAVRVVSRRLGPGSTVESWLLLAPFLVGVVVLVVGPAVLDRRRWRCSRPTSSGAAVYRGLGNFAELADDPIFLAAVRNSLIYIAGAVPLRVARRPRPGPAAAPPVPRRRRLPHGRVPADGRSPTSPSPSPGCGSSTRSTARSTWRSAAVGLDGPAWLSDPWAARARADPDQRLHGRRGLPDRHGRRAARSPASCTSWPRWRAPARGRRCAGSRCR